MTRLRLYAIGGGAALVALVGGALLFVSRDAGSGEDVAPQAVERVAEAAPGTAQPVPITPAVLAEAASDNPPVTVQVTAAKRVTPDTLRVDLALVSRSGVPATLEVKPGDLCLLTADGSRRLFALRDAEDKPVGGADFGPLAPNERRAVWVVFPAPPAADTRVTLLVGRLTLQNVPIS